MKNAKEKVRAVPARVKDLTGKVFGRLTVTGFGGFHQFPNLERLPKWQCSCSCGGTTEVTSASLRSGNTKSCGCLLQEAQKSNGKNNRTHGEAGGYATRPSVEYRVWSSMVTRTTNPASENYSRYGGRGIQVCPEWLSSYEQFLLDMGRRPSPKHSLDRINNEEGYKPGNCTWSTAHVQCQNKSNNLMIEWGGVRQCLSAWAEQTGIRRSTISYRLRIGWSVDKSLTTKPRRR